MQKRILLALMFPFICHAQSPRFSAGFMIMPEYVSLLQADPGANKEVVPKMGFSTGVSLEFALTRKLSIRSGVGYGYKRFGYNLNGLTFSSDIDPQLGFITESRMESSYLFREVQVPLILQYELQEDRFFVAAGADLIYAMSGESEQVIYFGNGVVEHTPLPQENMFNAGILLSAGYQFHFSRNLNIMVEPTFRYCMLPYLVDQAVNYNLGLKTTLNVEF